MKGVFMKKLGFGCMRLPVFGESKDFMRAEDIDLAQFCQMVDTFMERGFTYFDYYLLHNIWETLPPVKTPAARRGYL